MKTVLISVSVLFMISNLTNADHMDEWVKRINHVHFTNKCWGWKTMLGYRQIVDKLAEECIQLTPAFDIKLFENERDEDFAVFEDPDEAPNPFIGGNNFQTLPARLPFQQQQLQAPNNPMEAFLAFLAQAQAQQAQKEPMQYAATPFTRSKRALEEPTAADLKKFSTEVFNFKQDKKGIFGNLTCVMAKMGALNGQLDIKLSYFTDKLWDEFADGEEPQSEFKEKMIESYKNCYTLSRKIPQEILDSKGPMYQQFGRQKMFMKCAQKCEKELCVKKELAEWIEFVYGTPDKALRKRLGLPNDKYDAALMSWKVIHENEHPIKKYIQMALLGDM